MVKGPAAKAAPAKAAPPKSAAKPTKQSNSSAVAPKSAPPKSVKSAPAAKAADLKPTKLQLGGKAVAKPAAGASAVASKKKAALPSSDEDEEVDGDALEARFGLDSHDFGDMSEGSEGDANGDDEIDALMGDGDSDEEEDDAVAAAHLDHESSEDEAPKPKGKTVAVKAPAKPAAAAAAAAPAPAPAAKGKAPAPAAAGALYAGKQAAPASAKVVSLSAASSAAAAPVAAKALAKGKAAAAPPPPPAAPESDEEEEEEEEEDMGSDDDEGAPVGAKKAMFGSDDEGSDEEGGDSEGLGDEFGGADSEGDSDDDASFDGGDIEKAQAKLNELNATAAEQRRARVAANLAGKDVNAPAGEGEEERFVLPSKDDLEAERAGPPNLPSINRRIADVVAVLTDFRARRDPYRARTEYVECLAQDMADYYGYNRDLIDLFLGLFSPAEALAFLEANEQPRPVVIRVNTLKTRRRELAQALVNRGVRLDPVGSWTKVGLKVYESPVPIGATPEYLAGHYMLQAAASFVPVMALDARPGERVLDMCAAPGGKTSYIAQAMENKGVLVANDVRRDRLTPLYANLSRLGVTCVAVSCMDGRKIPGATKGFDRILLDAPCTGLGVIARDPSIKTQKGRDDVVRQSHLQKQLILAAIDALDCHGSLPGGGVLVYSTCSVTVEENEAVVNYALRKRHVKLVPLFEPDAGQEDVGRPGLTAHDHGSFHPSLSLSRRFYPHEHNMDGFYVAKLRKLSNAIPESAGSDEEDSEGEEGDSEEEGDDVEMGAPKRKAQQQQQQRKKRAAAGSDDEDDEEGSDGEGGKKKKTAAARVVTKSTLAPGAATLKRAAPKAKKEQQPRKAPAAKPAAPAAKVAAPAAPAAAPEAAAPAAAAGAGKRKRLPTETATPAERAMQASAAVHAASSAAAAEGKGAGKPAPAAAPAAAAAGEPAVKKAKKTAPAPAGAAPVPTAVSVPSDGAGSDGEGEGAVEPRRAVASFLKPGENPFRKKRKAGKRVQEAKGKKGPGAPTPAGPRGHGTGKEGGAKKKQDKGGLNKAAAAFA